MKAMGRGSVSSVLMVLLNVGWYGTALGLALAACLAIATPFMDLSGSEMNIPASFSVDARTFHVTAPTLGIQNAELEDGRGSGKLKFPPPSRAFFASTAVGLVVLLGLALWVIGLLRASGWPPIRRSQRDANTPDCTRRDSRRTRAVWRCVRGELLHHEAFRRRWLAIRCPAGSKRSRDRRRLDHLCDRRSLQGGNPPR